MSTYTAAKLARKQHSADWMWSAALDRQQHPERPRLKLDPCSKDPIVRAALIDYAHRVHPKLEFDGRHNRLAGWEVESDHYRGRRYYVTLSADSCTCPGFEFRGLCKHILSTPPAVDAAWFICWARQAESIERLDELVEQYRAMFRDHLTYPQFIAMAWHESDKLRAVLNAR